MVVCLFSDCWKKKNPCEAKPILKWGEWVLNPRRGYWWDGELLAKQAPLTLSFSWHRNQKIFWDLHGSREATSSIFFFFFFPWSIYFYCGFRPEQICAKIRISIYLFLLHICVCLRLWCFPTFFTVDMQLLGRTINLRSLITERMNKVFRENLEFLFDRFESQDLCAIVVSRFTFFLGLLSNKNCFPVVQQRINLVLVSGAGKVAGDFKACPWFTINGSFNWFIQSHLERDAREHISCVIFQSTCFPGLVNFSSLL